MAGPPAVEWRDKTEGRIKLGFAHESLGDPPAIIPETPGLQVKAMDSPVSETWLYGLYHDSVQNSLSGQGTIKTKSQFHLTSIQM